MAVLIKLLALLVKTVAKPVGNSIKRNAADWEPLRRASIGVGNFVHVNSLRLQILATGNLPREVKPLSDLKALNKGAEVMSEAFIFGIGGLVIVAELVHRSMQDAEKAAEAARKKRIEKKRLNERFSHIEDQIMLLHREIRQLRTELKGMKTHVGLELSELDDGPVPAIAEDDDLHPHAATKLLAPAAAPAPTAA